MDAAGQVLQQKATKRHNGERPYNLMVMVDIGRSSDRQ
jgi:hypothetical protein